MARKERERAEIEAKILLKRLEVECTTLIGDNSHLPPTDPEAGLDEDRPWNRNDEIRLRSLIRIMKTHRDAVRRSVVEIQSTSSILNSAFEYGEGKQISSLQEEKLSLENVVLLQELMAMKVRSLTFLVIE